MTRPGRFKNSYRLCWTTLAAVIVLQLLALAVAGPLAMPVLATTLPSMLLLVGAWSGITNWAEVRGENVGNPASTTDTSHQSVTVNQPSGAAG